MLHNISLLISMFGFGSSKKDTAKQQAEEFGPQWRAQVSTTISNNGSSSSSDGHHRDEKEQRWKPLEEWEAVYEPPKPPIQSTSAAQSYMAAKSKQLLVQKLKTRIVSRMLTIGEETCSKVLSKAEADADAMAAGIRDSSTSSSNEKGVNNKALLWDNLSGILNDMNGIILTFRFERDNATQCLYLRRVATDSVADAIQQVFENSDEKGEYIENLRNEVTFVIHSQKDKVKEFVETSLDDALQGAVAKAEGDASVKLTAAKKKLNPAIGTATTALDNVTGGEESVSDYTSNKKKIEELENNIKEQRVDIQDESVAMLSNCIKLLVLKKMDKLTVLLVHVVDTMFDSVSELYKTATESKLERKQLRDHVYNVVQTTHSDFQNKVTLETNRAVAVLQSIMADGSDDDDDQAAPA